MKHPITVESRRKKTETIQRAHPGARIIDVTSKAEEPWVRFSPFYPHGDIPVPLSHGAHAQSVEGIWQGLKVFETEGIDVAKFNVTSMKGIKRSVRTRGRVLGHRAGIESELLMDYLKARLHIYLPTYQFVLENRLADEMQQLREILKDSPLVLLDYETNSDIRDLRKPLSHASLIRAALLDEWPAL